MRRMIPLIALAVLVCAVGCKSPMGTDMVSTKTITFAQGSVVFNPPNITVEEGAYESTADGSTLTLPDGSVLKLTGGGAAGNLFIINMQNDGTDQAAKTDANATVDADVTPGG